MRDVLVLCYHAVSPRWEADLSITPEGLDRQVGCLIRRGWRPATFTDAVLGTSPARVLAITFDDAFASVREYAEPILTRRGAPATVFAPTEFMDGGARLAWPGVAHWGQTEFAGELEAMGWDDLRSLSQAGWEIGSHTLTHPHLTTLGDAALARELADSRARCSDELGRDCRSIAYPFGDVDGRVAAAAAIAGYVAGARLSSDLNQKGELQFPRVGIYYGDQWSRFRLKVSGPVRRIRESHLWSVTRRSPASV
jgi:peptidoglycan/xylan/chitin deacetylase (PgdA/CDA1 family)